MLSATFEKRTRTILLAPALTLLALTWLFLPAVAGAFDNTLVYPDFPWKGMKVQFTAKGNFLLKGHTDFDPLIYPQSESNPVLNVIQRRDLNLCGAGTVDHLDLSGKVILTIPGPAADFKDAYVDIGVYHYPPGDVDGEILQSFKRTLTNAEYQPIIEIPFNLNANITPGYPPGFSIILQVCRWQDPAHLYLECHTLDLNAVDITFSDDPAKCFLIEQTTPTDRQKNVDFDEPGIRVQFTTPYDPATVNEDTFFVYYLDKDGKFANLPGSITHNSDNTIAAFNPTEGLLDGVYYAARVWGKESAQSAGRTAWIKSIGGADLKRGKSWEFWTMPDLTDKITLVPVQTVEGQGLVKGKPTALKVFLRWERKPGVHPDWQLKELESNISLSWWENGTGRKELWGAAGPGTSWPPPFGTKIKREYQLFTNKLESYNKNEKDRTQDSVIYYGYIPQEEGTAAFEAEVLPLGQIPPPGLKPRSFSSGKVSQSVKATRGFHYTLLPFEVGNWPATNLVVPCPPGSGAGATCVNVEAVVSKNIKYLQTLFPVDPAEVKVNSGFSSKAAVFDGTFTALNPNKASEADWLSLLSILNR